MYYGTYSGLNERQQKILERIAMEGEVKIPALKQLFQVTDMTIRRDLEKLEEAGSIKRTFGGAIFVGVYDALQYALQERSSLLTEEKQLIGRAAAALVQPGESIFIDGGTTTFQLARYLPPGMKITVMTNALNVAAELSTKQIPTIMTGGMLYEATNSLAGPVAVQSLMGMAFDRVFLGASGLNVEHGFSNSNMYEAEIKRVAIRLTSEANILLDHSKFGTKVLVSFTPLSGVQRLVTDRMPEDELRLACEEAGMRIAVAK
ncbi:DeoR/GlpR family DNA-binding transcription regulator [Cohnella silvisoli]|uniref:DeoR/GlpR family DNA-binding transcription regulator n=1 Tax=Cohnella silvisoli TaxID=2873699 RepID=A0ABV1KMF8_9BACL|nr:DeoR/GlpR family DNA-binding transcription regulator [Cohnella silvisoli]MCD9020422.1 DeoR/GlpR family DNA-binding transcription regulator [Cohnella silvisoli]